MTIDHIALETTDLPASLDFYTNRFGAKVLYRDETWAFLKFGNVKLALVTPTEHPHHVAFAVTEDQLDQHAGEQGTPIDHHRDGTKGIYIQDPSGNTVELINYPKGETIYTRTNEGDGKR